MRRSDKEVTNSEELKEIIDTCKVCRIGMIDGNKPYIVPMDYGYTYEDEKLELFFHCAKKGRKIDVLTKNPNICFEMDCSRGLIINEEKQMYGTDYWSIIGEGKVEFLEDIEEKKKALASLMMHIIGKSPEVNPKALEHVCIFKIVPSWFTGKKYSMNNK